MEQTVAQLVQEEVENPNVLGALNDPAALKAQPNAANNKKNPSTKIKKIMIMYKKYIIVKNEY